MPVPWVPFWLCPITQPWSEEHNHPLHLLQRPLPVHHHLQDLQLVSSPGIHQQHLQVKIRMSELLRYLTVCAMKIELSEVPLKTWKSKENNSKVCFLCKGNGVFVRKQENVLTKLLRRRQKQNNLPGAAMTVPCFCLVFVYNVTLIWGECWCLMNSSSQYTLRKRELCNLLFVFDQRMQTAKPQKANCKTTGCKLYTCDLVM